MAPALFLFVAALAAPDNLRSPEIAPGGQVTFRLYAPKAAEVKLWGEWIPKYNTFEAMKRGEDGVWSATVGPVEPGIWLYIFLVDEVAVLDPRNPLVQTGRDGAAGSLLEVPGSQPAPYDLRPVPHGTVHLHTYTSSTGLGARRVAVYTPPGYGRDPRARYPVLFLLHGSGDTEMSWTAEGRAHLIADNLLADGRAIPMILVMPGGHVTAPRQPDPEPPELRRRFHAGLLRDVIPLVESRYRTRPGRAHRAIAGLSMGAFQALWFALDHPERTGALAIFGGGIFFPGDEAEVTRYATARPRREFVPFRIAIGARDMNLPLSEKLRAVLARHNVDHQYVVVPDAGHTWQFWRRSLADLLPVLFRTRPPRGRIIPE